MQAENAGRGELCRRVAEMSYFLKEQSIVVAAYDEQLVRRLIEKVAVYEDRLAVELKSGLMREVKE